jgi:hypothetical protein
MNFDHRNPRLRRGFAFVALAALLGLAVVGLSQCRLVDDSVTGVDLQAESSVHGRNSCVHECIKDFKACLRAEKARHKAALKACGGDDDDDDDDDGGGHHNSGSDLCRKQENLLHKTKLLECFNAFKDCKKNCYNEGAGSGGQ